MSNDDSRPWTFLTNHARVLVKIARDPNSRLRDIAVSIGITERAAQTIVNDLERAGYITRTRVGRRNQYSIDPDRPFRHPADANFGIKGLLSIFAADPDLIIDEIADPPGRVLIHDPLSLGDDEDNEA